MAARRTLRVTRKSAVELEIMAEAGRITALALQAAAAAVAPGVSTLEIDRVAEEVIREAGAIPSFKGYRGYPATVCVEVNEVVVHGIPRAEEVLREGDVVGLDVGACYEGFHGDSALTVGCGEVSEEAQRLMDVTAASLEAGIAAAVVGNLLGDISQAIEAVVQAAEFSCVRDLVGHGIGRQMHEAPQVPNFYDPRQCTDYDLLLRPGMTLAIEPMVNAGGPELRLEADQWTLRTADGELSAHFEHTIAVTKEGPVILTKA
jgi:methionyl aminopeptidase